jgi:hypothetical protein
METISPPHFHPRSAPPQERQIKHTNRFFPVIRGLPQVFSVYLFTDLYGKGEFLKKKLALKGMIRKFLNMVEVHIDGLRHPNICLFVTLLCVSVPLSII